MNKRHAITGVQNGRLVSVAEADRNQKRFDITDLDNEKKCMLIGLLCEFPDLFGSWRFTNRAIWVNNTPESEGLLAILEEHLPGL